MQFVLIPDKAFLDEENDEFNEHEILWLYFGENLVKVFDAILINDGLLSALDFLLHLNDELRLRGSHFRLRIHL